LRNHRGDGCRSLPFRIRGERALTDRTRLPDRRLNETQEFDRDGIHITMTVGFTQAGEVGEVFLNADRADSMLDVLMSDAAIICSIYSEVAA
jgi:hypothetical protein